MGNDTEARESLEVFFSYSRKDQALRDELEKHLSMLKRKSVITTWHDRKIGAGTAWAQQIDAHLNTAQIILLLISPDFLASDYCYGIEMNRAIERAKIGEARVIVVMLRPVDWEGAPFSEFQCLPANMVPVTSWSNIDDAFATISKGVREAVDDLLKQEEQKVKNLVQEKEKANLINAASAAQIFSDIQRDAQKAQAERWKILRETQTKIFQIQQDVVSQQGVTQDKMFKKWSDYIKS